MVMINSTGMCVRHIYGVALFPGSSSVFFFTAHMGGGGGGGGGGAWERSYIWSAQIGDVQSLLTCDKLLNILGIVPNLKRCTNFNMHNYVEDSDYKINCMQPVVLFLTTVLVE